MSLYKSGQLSEMSVKLIMIARLCLGIRHLYDFCVNRLLVQSTTAGL